MICGDYGERWIFWGEWFQKEANMARQFYVYYFPADSTVEIFDHRTKRLFLKRTRVEGITGDNFYIGSRLNIFGRQVLLKDFGDSATRNKLGSQREKTFCVLKPAAIPIMDVIISRIESENISIDNCAMLNLTSDEAAKLYENKQGESILPFLIEYITSGPILVMKLLSNSTIQKMIEICGPEMPDEAKKTAPNSIRAKYGLDLVKNVIHCSENEKEAKRELELFFPSNGKASFTLSTQLKDSTLGIIKPHAVKESKIGKILAAIYEGGFKITAMIMIYLEQPHCEEFYEIYRGVAPEYTQMVGELTNGPCIAFEVCAKDPKVNAYSEFRKLCGPVDPELAKQLRPHTIRAKFGVNKIMNAVHCTDLEEETVTEIQYFFKILQ